MIVIVNGTEVQLPEGACIADAIETLDRDPAGRGVAVAVNGTVVPRAAWAATVLSARDRVEVLTAVAGG